MNMEGYGPCIMPNPWLHAFIAVMSVVQAVAVAYLSSRAFRKDKKETRDRRMRSEE